jgi:hypothetical protein
MRQCYGGHGTSCADDMRLLHGKNRASFLFSFSSDLVFGGRKSDIMFVAFSA